jgi:hypothetical protein
VRFPPVHGKVRIGGYGPEDLINRNNSVSLVDREARMTTYLGITVPISSRAGLAG